MFVAIGWGAVRPSREDEKNGDLIIAEVQERVNQRDNNLPTLLRESTIQAPSEMSRFRFGQNENSNNSEPQRALSVSSLLPPSISTNRISDRTLCGEQPLEEITEEEEEEEEEDSLHEQRVDWKLLKPYLFTTATAKGYYRPGLILLFVASLIFCSGFTFMQFLGAEYAEVEYVEIEIDFAMHILSSILTFSAIVAASVTLNLVKHQKLVSPIIFSAGIILGDILKAASNTYKVNLSKTPWFRRRSVALTRNNIVLTVAMFTFALCFIVMIVTSQVVSMQHEQFYATLESLQEEKRKTDRLLNSIMPRKIANRIKRGEKNINESHDRVTVIFIDIVDFSLISECITRSHTMCMLHSVFSGFDDLAKRHGVTKVKLAGNRWMGACGITRNCDDHAAIAIRFGLDSMKVVKDFNEIHAGQPDWPYIRIHIGMSSGRCISGIIGHQVYHFDIWGPCVNIASRMASLCPEPNSIQISESTYKSLVHYIRWFQHIRAPSQDSELQEPYTLTASSSSSSSCSSHIPVHTLLDMNNGAISLPVEQLPMIFVERGTIQVKGKGAMKSFVCRTMSESRCIQDKALADSQKTRLQEIPLEKDMVVVAMDNKQIDIVRKGMMSQNRRFRKAKKKKKKSSDTTSQTSPEPFGQASSNSAGKCKEILEDKDTNNRFEPMQA